MNLWTLENICGAPGVEGVFVVCPDQAVTLELYLPNGILPEDLEWIDNQ